MASEKPFLFVSYTGKDKSWAVWVATVLERAGLRVKIQEWDVPVGANFVEWMDTQVGAARWTVALYSRAYFDSQWCTTEWTAALARRNLLPIRIEPVKPPAILRALSWVDLFGLDESQAEEAILHAVRARIRPRLGSFPGKATDQTRSPSDAAGNFSRSSRRVPPTRRTKATSTTARASSAGSSGFAERSGDLVSQQIRDPRESVDGLRGNADFRWERFDSAAYVDHNYRTVRADDQQILERVRDHFAGHFEKQWIRGPASGLTGADLGAGPNLYPALSMLPWVESLHLVEYSPANCEWLRGEVKFYGPNWDPFWDVLTQQPAYADVEDPRIRLETAASITQESLFEPRREIWDLATMFFVAESISSRPEEFTAAVDGFVDALRVGAPFAAAFMERSTGYEVGTEFFPAVPVSLDDVKARLGGRTRAVVERIGLADNPIRDGYTGMIIALGVKTAR